jgi:hypothetical protein
MFGGTATILAMRYISSEMTDFTARNCGKAMELIAPDVEKFPRGIYIVRLTGDDKFVYTKRIILK